MLADGSLDEDEEMTYLGSVVSTTGSSGEDEEITYLGTVVSTTGSNGEGQSRGNWLTQVLC